MQKLGIFLFFPLVLLVACEEREPIQTVRTAENAATSEIAGGKESDLLLSTNVQEGRRIYRQACATCHREGIAGAPKMGDKEAWQPSIAKGMEELVRNSIDGFQGNRGVMPPKGGAKSLTDEEVAAAVVYMVEQNR